MEIKISKNCPDTEYSPQFVQGMMDRMAVSFHKYGPVDEANGQVDVIASLRVRLAKYEATGNTEFLMDVANFAMMEFMHNPGKFMATDARESPGRAWLPSEFDDSVEVSARANDGTPQG